MGVWIRRLQFGLAVLAVFVLLGGPGLAFGSQGPVTLPGYEDTVWGVTGPDGQVVGGIKPSERMNAERPEGIRVRIDGFDVEFPDQGPVLEQGRVLVPMRPVFEHFAVQCRVSWDETARQAEVRDQRDRQVIFQPGEYSYLVIDPERGERRYPLDVPATVINGRVLLPLRALLETFAYKVAWLEPYQLVDIQDSFPGWRQLLSREEWEQVKEAECVPCALIKEAS